MTEQTTKRPRTGPKPRYETVAAQINNYILTEGYQPLAKLPTEHQFAEMLHVGRTSIREALKILVALGVVTTQRGSGLYVADHVSPLPTVILATAVPVETKDVVKLYEYRITLETSTAFFAAQRITASDLRALRAAVKQNEDSAAHLDQAEKEMREAFRHSDAELHRIIAHASDNQYFEYAIALITRQQNWVFGIASGGPQQTLLTLARQHRKILEAIENGPPEAAAKEMEEHLKTALKNFQEGKRQQLRAEIEAAS